MSDHSLVLPPTNPRPLPAPLCREDDVTRLSSNRLAKLHHFDANSASVTTYSSVTVRENGNLVPSSPDLPTAPITLHGASYRIAGFHNRRAADTLVPLARRSGLPAVARAYDDGLSVPVLA